MWDLDYKVGWALKNWCFWIVMLEKTTESSLDYKEIKPVNPKEINPEYSLEGLILKLKLPKLLLADVKSQLIEKDPDYGKHWGQKKEVTGWDGWMASLTQWTLVWANSWRQWRTGKPGVLHSMGSQSQSQLGDWKTTTILIPEFHIPNASLKEQMQNIK